MLINFLYGLLWDKAFQKVLEVGSIGPSGEESWFYVWGVLSILCLEKLCPIMLLIVYVVIFIYYFCLLIAFIGVFCDR